MNYKPREGVILITICGVKLLVPNHHALKNCENGIRLSFLGLLVWNTVSQGKDISYAVRLLSEISRRTTEECEVKVKNELNKLYEAGFIVNKDKD